MTRAAPLPWLLDPENSSARTLALTQLLDRPADDPDVLAAQAAIPNRWPARGILDAQWPAGYWMRPGVGYSPKYKATVWQLVFLASLGARRTEVLDRACAYVLEHSRLTDGRFSAHKTVQGAVVCLNGNLLRAMRQLGFEDPRLEETTEVLAGMVARDSFHCRFNAPKPLPVRMRDGLPCAWGAVKALGAFAEVLPDQRSREVREAIEAGIEFLLSGNLADGSYPTATRPSPLWLTFGFPLGYTSDLIEALEVLRRLGAGRDPRVAAAAEIVWSRRAGTGRWALEYTPGNTWTNFGIVGEPNKWVTLRALVALRDWE